MTDLLSRPASHSDGLLLPPESQVLGLTVPRLWTPPLRELTPETSLGFDIIDFAEQDLGAPLDPWQQWTVIHGFELMPDGRTRFKKLLILVARQNGKTHLCVVLTLYWMYVQRVPLILGTSTKLEYAKDSWEKAKKLARSIPEMNEEISHRGAVKTVNGGVVMWRADEEERRAETGSKYKIAPANEEGGRSQTVDRLILDELRQHHNYSAYDAAEPTTSVPWSSMIVGLSNMGDDRSVVLNDLRKDAIEYINTGEGDPRLGLIEYSCLPTDKPDDVHALAKSNPNMNRRGLDGLDLVVEGRAALRVGGKKLTGYMTEKMCIHVPAADPAVTPQQWIDCKHPGTMALMRNRIAMCFDVSQDEMHAVLVAAGVMGDGRVRVEVVAAWSGTAEMKAFAKQFRAHVRRVRPKALGWIPNSPSAAFAALLSQQDAAEERVGVWPPPNVKVEALRGDVPALCMGFAQQIKNQEIAHSDDPILNAHVPGADKLWVGSTWVVSRQGDGYCDGYYAAAGAVHLARKLPAGLGKPRIILPSSE